MKAGVMKYNNEIIIENNGENQWRRQYEKMKSNVNEENQWHGVWLKMA